MGMFGIQLGTRDMLDKRPIGKVYVYPLDVMRKGNIDHYSINQSGEPDVFEVIEILDTPNNTKIYLTNQWNDFADDIQAFSEDLIKEFISYE